MDIKHVLGTNPLHPAYRLTRSTGADPGRPGWVDYQGGLIEIGADARAGFGFDNEFPRHQEFLRPFQLADRLATSRRMASNSWRTVASRLPGTSGCRMAGWPGSTARKRPRCTGSGDGDGWWQVYTLYGPGRLDPALPVVHISYYEADAYSPAGGGPACPPRRNGSGRPGGRTRTGCSGSRPPSPRRPGPVMVDRAAVRIGLAVDGERLPAVLWASAWHRAQWVSTTASSWSTSTSFGEAPPSPPGACPADLPQLLSGWGPLAGDDRPPASPGTAEIRREELS